ncbi:MAG: hypothetical protein AABX23_03280 [Nanoarchaeota archaeon]
MNRFGKILGNILANFPGMIVVFFFMVLFVILAGFISIDFENEENIANNFGMSYIIFNNEILTVREAVDKGCKSGKLYSLNEELKEVLIREFSDRYGYGYAFVFATRSSAHFDINARYFAHLKFQAFENFAVSEIPASEFEKIFDTNTKNYDAIGFCNPNELNLFIKRVA